VNRIHVVLVYPEIHWNTGNAGRTCVATGAALHLVEPLGFSLDEQFPTPADPPNPAFS
jgi:tRNA (cytidine/uridine-2'-O-)-methyltransferase